MTGSTDIMPGIATWVNVLNRLSVNFGGILACGHSLHLPCYVNATRLKVLALARDKGFPKRF